MLCIVIFGCIAYVFHVYSFNREERSAIRYTHAKLDNMAMSIERKIHAVENSVRRAAPVIEQHLNAPEMMSTLVERWVKEDTLIMGGAIAFEPNYYPKEGKWFMEYVVIDSLGQAKHKHLGSEEYDYFDMEWYNAAKQSNHGIWSEPYFDEGGGQVNMVTYSLPLQDKNGRVYAVITADVAIDELINAIHSLQLYKDSRIFMSTKRGTFITHWHKDMICKSTVDEFAHSLGNDDAQLIANEIKAGKRGTQKIEMNGHDAMALYTTVPDVGWRLCAFCTYKSIMGELLGTTLTILGIFLVGLLLLGGCISFIIRHEMKPLEHLARAARKIGRGDFNVELPSIDGNDELKLLHDSFASMQTSLSDYVKELKTVTASKQRIESELHIAHALQMNMLPNIFPPFPDRKDIDLYASLTSAKEVGGDLYDFFIRDEKLFFAVGDVSGKGIPASLFMAITRSLFRIVAGGMESPAVIAKLLNNAVAEENDTNMFVTMFIGAIDMKTGLMTFCNAGHNPPILMPTTGECRYMDVCPNLPIGIMQGYEFKEQTLDINDMGLLVYTDGVTEAENANHTLFGEERLRKTCEKMKAQSSSNIIKGVAEAVNEYVGEAPQSDDITILHLKLKVENNSSATLNIHNKLADLEQLPAFLQDFASANGVDEATIGSLNLALEEALVNVINYAYPDGTVGDITLKAEKDSSGKLIFTLIDSGTPFDPTTVPDADTTLSVEERQIGGLGIFLVRQLMDSVEYSYKDGCNVLTMMKQLSK